MPTRTGRCGPSYTMGWWRGVGAGRELAAVQRRRVAVWPACRRQDTGADGPEGRASGRPCTLVLRRPRSEWMSLRGTAVGRPDAGGAASGNRAGGSAVRMMAKGDVREVPGARVQEAPGQQVRGHPKRLGGCPSSPTPTCRPSPRARSSAHPGDRQPRTTRYLYSTDLAGTSAAGGPPLTARSQR